ncbi:MAG: hypothetical protein ACW99U_14375 [Candidatus Thorarchaeota archaeon]
MFSDEISADELGIDLNALALAAPNIAGRAKPKPSLTDSASKRPVGRPPKEDEGLFAWCEQFSYTPGVDFLKLNRSFPKLWEGITINGFIEDVYEPIDEHWLAERWGGGAYQLDVYQRDSTGRSRKVGTKFVEISGMPKAFMGNDGMPYALPSQQTATSSRKSADVLRRRMGIGKFRNRDDRDYEDEAPSRQPTQNLDRPLTDASTLYKVMQESKKSDTEALGVLREAQRDVQSQMQATAQQQADMYRTLLQQQKEEMQRVREEGRLAAENSSAPFKEMLQFMATQGNSSSSRDNLEVLRSAHDTAITQLTREHSSHLEDMRRSYETRLSQMMDELNRLRTDYTSDVERVRADYLEKEKSAKDDAFRQYQTQMEMLRNQTSDLRERHRDELSTALREKNETLSALRQDLTELRTSLNQKDHDHRMAILERESTLRSEYNERERVLNERILKLEGLSRTNLVEERQRLKEEFEDRYNSKFEAAKSSFETRYEALQQSSKIEIESARRELAAQYEGQTVRLESQLAQLKGEYKSREQLSLERSRLEQESAQREREQQRLLLETSAQSREALAEMAKKQLESKLREVSKELEAQRRLSETRAPVESSDPFEQLERLSQIKERLKRHGFTDASEESSETETKSEPEKPKDFMGKLMHYGPKFVGPILERIDAATSVAQQSLDQQQAQAQAQELLRSRQALLEHQQNADVQRAAADERELALRERRQMLEQRRILRERQISEERAVAAQEIERQRQANLANIQQYTAPQQADVADVDPVSSPSSELSISEGPIGPVDTIGDDGMEGYRQLADYLNTALSEGKQPSAIVSQLKMAQMMGMFSKETLNSVLAEDFDTLLEKLGAIHPALKRPKSRVALKSVLEGMK